MEQRIAKPCCTLLQPLPPFSSSCEVKDKHADKDKGEKNTEVYLHTRHFCTHKNSSSNRVNSSKEKGPRAEEPCLPPRPSPFPEPDFPSEPIVFPIAPHSKPWIGACETTTAAAWTPTPTSVRGDAWSPEGLPCVRGTPAGGAQLGFARYLRKAPTIMVNGDGHPPPRVRRLSTLLPQLGN